MGKQTTPTKQREKLKAPPLPVIINRDWRIKTYSSPEELQNKICQYFEQEEVPNVLGLAGFLGVHYETLYKWENGERDGKTPWLSCIIKRAKQALGDWTVKNAMRNKINCGMAVFYMKNVFGWQDKQETTTNVNFELGDKLQQYLEASRTKQVKSKHV